MRQVRLALGVAAALTFGTCAPVQAQDPGAGPTVPITGPITGPITAAKTAPPVRPADEATTASMAAPLRDPDAEVAYLPPRRVIAPPLYGNPGPPLNPGGVPYDELFASPYPFDLPSALVPPEDDPYPY